jgi:hypothetical protein
MLENGQFINANSIKGVRNIPTINENNPGPGQYNSFDIIALQGKSPLKAAF